MRTTTLVLTSALLLAALSGCAGMGPNGNAGMGIGALGGCAVGVALAHNAGGCAAGGVVGGIGGAAIGTSVDQQNGTVPVASPPPVYYGPGPGYYAPPPVVVVPERCPWRTVIVGRDRWDRPVYGERRVCR